MSIWLLGKVEVINEELHHVHVIRMNVVDGHEVRCTAVDALKERHRLKRTIQDKKATTRKTKLTLEMGIFNCSSIHFACHSRFRGKYSSCRVNGKKLTRPSPSTKLTGFTPAKKRPNHELTLIDRHSAVNMRKLTNEAKAKTKLHILSTSLRILVTFGNGEPLFHKIFQS